MTLEPSRPLRPLRWGISGPNHARLSLESSQHIYKFLPKRPYLLSNDNNMYLGPVVEAQLVLDPSPQISYPRKEKKGEEGTSVTTKGHIHERSYLNLSLKSKIFVITLDKNLL